MEYNGYFDEMRKRLKSTKGKVSMASYEDTYQELERVITMLEDGGIPRADTLADVLAECSMQLNDVIEQQKNG